jgi:Uma2 family endonuclease
MSTAFLEIPKFRRRVSPITVEEYHGLSEFNERGRRTELVRGIVIEKMSKSPLHSSIASFLYDLLQPLVPPGYWLRKKEPLTFRDSELEPDISIVPGSRNDYSTRHPSSAALVIEIAVTSPAEDRALAAVYAEAEVAEYWIVFPREWRIEVYRQPASGTYTNQKVVEGDTVLACESIRGIVVNLSQLFR